MIGDSNVSEEIINRLIVANRSYVRLKCQFKSQLLSRKTKVLIYKRLLRPILMYAQKPGLRQKMKEDLSIFERKILRRIYGPVCEGGQWQKG